MRSLARASVFVLAAALALPARAQDAPKPADKPADEGKKPEEKKPEEKPADEKKPDEKKPDEKPADEKKPDEKPATPEEARAAFDEFAKIDVEIQATFAKIKELDDDVRKTAEAYEKTRREAQQIAAKKKDDPELVAKKAALAALEKSFNEKKDALVKAYGDFEETQRPRAVQAFRKAGVAIESAMKAKPDDAGLKLVKARLLCSLGQFKEALPLAEASSKAFANDKDAQLAYAKCLLGTNQFELGSTVLASMSKADPASREVKARLGISLYAQNKFAEAKATLAGLGEVKDLPLDVQQALDQWSPDALIEPWSKEAETRKGEAQKDDLPRVKLETSKGAIVLELFEDAAPNTVANFVSLVEKGYYDGTVFHRVIPQFMAQGGDPKGTGEGGPGYRIKDEVGTEATRRLHWRGVLSMAKTAEKDSGGSQFFITVVPTPHLNGLHTVFGRVLEGQGVVDALDVGDLIKKATVVRKRQHDYKPETIAEHKKPLIVPDPDGGGDEDEATLDKKKPEKKKEEAPTPKKDEGAPAPKKE